MNDKNELYFFLNGNILKGNNLNLSPFDRGFLFGHGVYETLRWHKGKLFKLDLHIERLKKSLSSSRIIPTKVGITAFSERSRLLSGNEIEKNINELISLNNFKFDEHLFIYLQITRGVYFPRQHQFPPENVEPTLFISVTRFNRPEDYFKNGIKVILEDDVRWTRCDIKSTMLMANVLARQKAIEQNAVEAIFIRDGIVTEGTHTSFCAVKNGTLFTPPLSNFILDGITRKIILEICAKEKITFRETEIRKDELKSFDEMMMLGTISEVMPVIQVDDWKVGSGKPGEITLRLQSFLSEMILA